MPKREINNEAVFLSAVDDDGVPILAVGLSAAAWDYIKDGKTHNIDCVKLGIPLRLMIFGGDTRESILKKLREDAKDYGIDVKDGPVKSFGFDKKPLN